MIQVYSEYYRRRYYAPYFSLGSACCFISFIILVILPFLLSFASPNFWEKVNFYHEQPIVTFNGNIYLQESDIAGNTVLYSTIPQLQASNSIIPDISYTTEDINSDGIDDVLTIEITHTKTIDSFQANLALGITYELIDIANTKMNLVLFQSVSASGLCNIDATGSLQLKQRNLLKSSNILTVLNYADDIFTTLVQSGFAGAMEKNEQINQGLEFKGTVAISSCQTQDTIRLKYAINIPQQKVLYTPQMLELLKFAWMQYMSFFLPIYAIIYLWMMRVLYKNGAISTKVVENSIVKKVEKKIKKY